MKHVVAASHNLSSRQASQLGIWNSRKRAEKVVAFEEINRIKSKHLHFAKVEQKVFLESIGRNPNFYLSDSSSSEDEYSEGEDKDLPSGEVVYNPENPPIQENPYAVYMDVISDSDENVNQQPDELSGQQEHQTPSPLHQSESSFSQSGEGKSVRVGCEQYSYLRRTSRG